MTRSVDTLLSLLAGVVGGVIGGCLVVALVAVLWAMVFQANSAEYEDASMSKAGNMARVGF